ncbi:helix-turn-helix domain-containing protein [Azorhizobium doebereinerae]|uniref:helix-turn-helix domain-containing protein n=1 Tax=Azorhizobium doebereinerae TaxID=281091 RepID=UPI001FDA8F10|nr:helix-turn-helix domain-containing protein [Azorhizobium doebereinerae]
MARNASVRAVPLRRRRASSLFRAGLPWGRAASARASGSHGTGGAVSAGAADLLLLCRLAVLLAARQQQCAADLVMATPTREAPVAGARQLAMYLAHVALGLSQCQVAVGFARDRRTVAHACRRVEDRRDDAAFDAQVADIEYLLRWAVGR